MFLERQDNKHNILPPEVRLFMRSDTSLKDTSIDRWISLYKK